jgi:hypothetical protein
LSKWSVGFVRLARFCLRLPWKPFSGFGEHIVTAYPTDWNRTLPHAAAAFIHGKSGFVKDVAGSL